MSGKPTARAEWMSRPRVDFPVIVRVASLRGSGVEGNPYREVTGYYDLDGRLLFGFDPAPPATPTSPDKAADGVGSADG